MRNNLDIQVRELLNKHKGDWQEIAQSSNVSYSWISKFVNGHIPNPGYATLRDLQAHLAKPSRKKATA
ncbi:MAG: hypothetical protein HYX42_04150 [Polaromonas sp.]|uniref:hypothetical protein n=1 Tax=Polaromonas sp. TaxID=1869339 RepID=UPI0025EAF3E5|nr:hypothetical protein [Polaromonas sp.]MBI2725422.1 hypothetical protein [Polaromonas sp.]